VLSFNAAAARLFGRPAEKVLGEHISLLIPALAEGMFLPAPSRWGESARGRREIEGRRADGRPVPLDVAVSAGEVNRRRVYTVIVRDLTESRRAEQELTYERTLLRCLLDNVPDRIYFKDEQSRFIRVNRALAQQFGLDDPAAAIGKTDFDFFTLDHAGPAYRDEQELMRTGQPIVDIEEKETWPDGRVSWVSTTKLPLRDRDGRVVGSFGISRDITARKKAEAELRQNEARYRSLYNDTPVMLHSTDPVGRMARVSDYWLATLGYTREEVLGRDLTEFLSETSRRYANEVVRPAFLRTGQCHNIEYQFVRKDGTVLDCLLSAVLEHDADGRTLQSIAVVIDIS